MNTKLLLGVGILLLAGATFVVTAPAGAANCEKNPNHRSCQGGGGDPPGGGGGDDDYLVGFHDLWDGASGTGILTFHDSDRGWANYTERKDAEGCTDQPETWTVAMARQKLSSGRELAHNVLTSDASATVLDLANTGVPWQRYVPEDDSGIFDGCFGNGVLQIEFRDTAKKRQPPTEMKFHWEFEVYRDNDTDTAEFFVMTTDWLYPSDYDGSGNEANQHWHPEASTIMTVDGWFDFSRVVQNLSDGVIVTEDDLGRSRLQFWFHTQPPN